MKNRLIRRIVVIGSVAVALGALVLFETGCLSSFGVSPRGARLERMRASPRYHDGEFINDIPVHMIEPGQFWSMIGRQLFGSEERIPPHPLHIEHLKPGSFADVPAPGLRAVWFGHASVMVEIDGVRLLTDPILSDRASPFEDFGPRRFFSAPMRLDELPKIHAVLISHDHYDHLDMKTVVHLASKGAVFFVPLGVGAHLEFWGIAPNQIVEMDWWEKRKLGAIEVVCTPAIHYSGRGLFKRNPTLWSSWSIIGPVHRFFHSGDSGFGPHFAEIGKRFGPFDLTSIKVGAYDVSWEGIHMSPELAGHAHVVLRGKRMLPVHWGTFNMAIHEWDEPIRRIKTQAERLKIDLLTPRPGEVVDVDKAFASTEWWTESNQ